MKWMKRFVWVLSIIAMLGLFGGTADAILGSIGPTDPANGFPGWYTDQNGLTLELCLDTGGFCLVTPDILPDPLSPISFPDNFPGEAFWFDAAASIDTAGGVSAALTLALEAAFLGELAVEGEQSAFVRQRMRISGLPAAAIGQNYTITHPYAQHVFTAVSDGLGGAEINETIDAPSCFADPTPVVGFSCDRTGVFPNFSSLLQGVVGPFLMWDPLFPPDAPPGYIGNPGVAHQVIGSPTGNNFFRVEGPNVDGLGGNVIETPLFFLQGKIRIFNAEILALVTKYYNDILGRAPEPGAAEAWTASIERIVGLGIDVREGFIVLAKVFFNSAEYLGMLKNDTEYVTDLYQTFLDRLPDAGGQAFWEGLLAGGLSREVILNFFAFSAEFDAFLDGIFGAGPGTRPETGLTNDLYRGLLSRLADSAGFNFWLGNIRAAQCVDAASVQGVAKQMATLFTESSEFAARARTDAEYLSDLYDAFMRRGAFLAEFDGWLTLMGGGMTRAQVLSTFVASVEYQGRVQNVIDAGCILP